MVLKKLRAELVTKDRFILNKIYEGSPTAGIVEVPVRDHDHARDYTKSTGFTLQKNSTTYMPYFWVKGRFGAIVADSR
ncbi:MAG: hypothetical protein QM296_03585 [Bacillota bacterium]|nr:hypothetical protein [Bacillota bacterium]